MAQVESEDQKTGTSQDSTVTAYTTKQTVTLGNIGMERITAEASPQSGSTDFVRAQRLKRIYINANEEEEEKMPEKSEPEERKSSSLIISKVTLSDLHANFDFGFPDSSAPYGLIPGYENETAHLRFDGTSSHDNSIPIDPYKLYEGGNLSSECEPQNFDTLIFSSMMKKEALSPEDASDPQNNIPQGEVKEEKNEKEELPSYFLNEEHVPKLDDEAKVDNIGIINYTEDVSLPISLIASPDSSNTSTPKRKSKKQAKDEKNIKECLYLGRKIFEILDKFNKVENNQECNTFDSFISKLKKGIEENQKGSPFLSKENNASPLQSEGIKNKENREISFSFQSNADMDRRKQIQRSASSYINRPVTPPAHRRGNTLSEIDRAIANVQINKSKINYVKKNINEAKFYNQKNYANIKSNLLYNNNEMSTFLGIYEPTMLHLRQRYSTAYILSQDPMNPFKSPPVGNENILRQPRQTVLYTTPKNKTADKPSPPTLATKKEGKQGRSGRSSSASKPELSNNNTNKSKSKSKV